MRAAELPEADAHRLFELAVFLNFATEPEQVAQAAEELRTGCLADYPPERVAAAPYVAAGVVAQLERAGPVARARRADGVRTREGALGPLVAKEQGIMDAAHAVLRRAAFVVI